MSTLISGVLKDGAGIPLAGCQIILKSRVNTSETVASVVAHIVTGPNGEYEFEARTGKYRVYLKPDCRNEFHIGVISVYEDSQPGTLNDFLIAVSDVDLKPDVLRRFDELARRVHEDANSAEQFAGDARRAVDELSGKVQDDIRDRTPDRLALPGAYGFGGIFTRAEALSFQGVSDFGAWLQKATPGRYPVTVADSSALLLGTTKFNGNIDVLWSPFDNDGADTAHKFKTLLCYNEPRAGEHGLHLLQYWYEGDNLRVAGSMIVCDAPSLATLLSATAGADPSGFYRYPAVGSLLLAAYHGASAGAGEVSIATGDVVPGSRLGPVSIPCAVNEGGTTPSPLRAFVGGAGQYNFPGRYQALSGANNVRGNNGFICLFVRVE